MNIVVFDLDGTLIQSDQFTHLVDYDFTVSHYWDDEFTHHGVRVKVRPGSMDILNILREKYHLALFSHSFPEYINEIIFKAGLKKHFTYIFNNYDEIDGKKDLRVVLKKFGLNPDSNLNKIIIIDDNRWSLQEKNLLLIDSYSGGADDLFSKNLIAMIDKKMRYLNE